MSSPLAGQMLFRMTLFSTFGWAKRWLGTNPDGSERQLTTADLFKAGCRGCAPRAGDAAFCASEELFAISLLAFVMLCSQDHKHSKMPELLLSLMRRLALSQARSLPLQRLRLTSTSLRFKCR